MDKITLIVYIYIVLYDIYYFQIIMKYIEY